MFCGSASRCRWTCRSSERAGDLSSPSRRTCSDRAPRFSILAIRALERTPASLTTTANRQPSDNPHEQLFMNTAHACGQGRNIAATIPVLIRVGRKDSHADARRAQHRRQPRRRLGRAQRPRRPEGLHSWLRNAGKDLPNNLRGHRPAKGRPGEGALQGLGRVVRYCRDRRLHHHGRGLACSSRRKRDQERTLPE
jgi:hypothetical protein